MKEFCVYILASKHYGTLYVGMTSNLIQRIYQHKNNLVDGFTKTYSIHDLVYYEQHGNFEECAKREKQIKAWKRQWKINLIEEENPYWQDLYIKISDPAF